MNPWNGHDLAFDETAFQGVTRLFPLPNLVLFPHVVQPLHVFEERYREMVEDALAGDRLITMAVLEPGWEPDYDSRPPIASIGCLGRIVAQNCLDDGRFNLLLLGVRRVKIIQELQPVRAFRQAKVELLADRYADDPALDPEGLRCQLLEAFQHHLPTCCQATEQLDDLLNEQIPLAALTDLVSYTLPIDLRVKQQLLTEVRVEVRAELLLDQLRDQLKPQEVHRGLGSEYPPPFSSN